MLANEYKEKVYSVFNYIENRLQEDLNLSQLAFHANYSVFHFHRIFNEMIGETPINYFRRIKLENAAFSLKVSEKKIIDIAFEAGYENHESFSRAFKNQFKVSPREFRDKYNVYKNKDTKKAEFIIESEIRIVNLDSFSINFERFFGSYLEIPGPYKDSILWNKFISEHNFENGKSILAGVCLDDPEITEESKIRFDLAIISSNNSISSHNTKIIKGGKFAVATHLGDYKNLISTYEYMLTSFPLTANKKIRNEPAFEIYLNPFPENRNLARTEVFIPIE